MDSLMAYVQNNPTGGSGMSSVWYIIMAAGLWKMMEKAGEPGWAGIIPLYNQYKLCEKTMKNPWYWLRLFIVIIPIIGWIGYFYFAYQMGKAVARSYGQPDSWAWGYTFLAPVFYCITGFGNYSYYGPFGEGDMRTGEAREAKTVDFDVVEQAADVQPVDVQEVKAEESEVEFDFNQDDVE